MSVNRLNSGQNATSVLRRYIVGITSVFLTDTPKGQFVNVSADLTRSIGLRNFTTPALGNLCGQKEQ